MRLSNYMILVAVCSSLLLGSCSSSKNVASESQVWSAIQRLNEELNKHPDNKEAKFQLLYAYWAVGDKNRVKQLSVELQTQYPDMTVRINKLMEFVDKVDKIDLDAAAFEEGVRGAIANYTGTSTKSTEAFLEINTLPSGANVIVNDRYIGHSPVKVSVDPSRDATIQIFLEGYKDVIKLVNHNELSAGKTENLLYKLQPVK